MLTGNTLRLGLANQPSVKPDNIQKLFLVDTAWGTKYSEQHEQLSGRE